MVFGMVTDFVSLMNKILTIAQKSDKKKKRTTHFKMCKTKRSIYLHKIIYNIFYRLGILCF